MEFPDNMREFYKLFVVTNYKSYRKALHDYWRLRYDKNCSEHKLVRARKILWTTGLNASIAAYHFSQWYKKYLETNSGNKIDGKSFYEYLNKDECQYLGTGSNDPVFEILDTIVNGYKHCLTNTWPRLVLVALPVPWTRVCHQAAFLVK